MEVPLATPQAPGSPVTEGGTGRVDRLADEPRPSERHARLCSCPRPDTATLCPPHPPGPEEPSTRGGSIPASLPLCLCPGGSGTHPGDSRPQWR